MHKKFTVVLFTSLLFVGCATVPMENPESTNKVQTFSAPSEGNAALYIYRPGIFGGALKKDVWVDEKCIGETAPKMFFYQEVQGGIEHKISTESEFSPNDLIVKTESGKSYFIRQYIKPGVFVGGAGLELVEESRGKVEVAKLQMAAKGTCSQ